MLHLTFKRQDFVQFFRFWQTVPNIVYIWNRSRNRYQNFSKVGTGTATNLYGSTTPHFFMFFSREVVMSKTKGLTFRYRFGNEAKKFWYCSLICLVENRLFRFGPESALLDQTEVCSFDGADSGTNSDVLVSFLLDVRTFVERLWNVCSFTVLTLLSRRTSTISPFKIIRNSLEYRRQFDISSEMEFLNGIFTRGFWA
jgi:hypothetical protein